MGFGFAVAQALARFKQMADDYVEYMGLDLAEDDRCGDAHDEPAKPKLPIVELNLQDALVASIVWATGYRYDFGWLKVPVLDDAGVPIQSRGVTTVPGLYFLGLRRMHTVKSALLSKDGVGADAAYIAERISAGDGLRQSPNFIGPRMGTIQPS